MLAPALAAAPLPLPLLARGPPSTTQCTGKVASRSSGSQPQA